MGDVADMILDGILDEQTGEFIDDEISYSGGCGHPRTMQPVHSVDKSYTYRNKISGPKKYIHKRYDISIGTGTLHRIVNLYGKEHYWSNTIMKQPLRQKINGISGGNWRQFKNWLNKDIIISAKHEVV